MAEARDQHWLKARVHRVDSHVYWTAITRSKPPGGRARSDAEFEGLVSEDYIFHDFLRRSVIQEIDQVRRSDEDFIIEECWDELQAFLRAPFVFGGDTMMYRVDEPPPHFWYQIDVDSIAPDSVICDITWQGYKNRLSGLVLRKPLFYDVADRLKARLRFRTDWSSLDEIRKSVRIALKQSAVLGCIRDDLEEELRRLDQPSPTIFNSVCSNVFPLLERLLRDIRKKNGWEFGQRNLGQLISGFDSIDAVPDELNSLLDLIVRPYRNHVQHGHPLTPIVSKMTLVTALESIVRLADHFERSNQSAGDKSAAASQASSF